MGGKMKARAIDYVGGGTTSTCDLGAPLGR